MSVRNDQWLLFGLDTRRIAHHWVSAWREWLFDAASPLRQRLDEPVSLHRGDVIERYRGAVRIPDVDAPEPEWCAVLLPDEWVLTRSLRLPLAADAELDAVLAMEVAAASPFRPDDTVFAWRRTGSDTQTLTIVLAIASRTAVSEWASRQQAGYQQGVAQDACEIWVQAEDSLLKLNGFGGAGREDAYRRRLRRLGMRVTVPLILILAMAGVYALQQRSSLDRVEVTHSELRSAAKDVIAGRDALLAANDQLRAANKVIAAYASPHVEMARISALLGDNSYVSNFAMQGRELRLRGRSTDAALVMQKLAEEPSFAEVKAPQAITQVGNTGLEQFYLDIKLEPAAPGSDSL